MKKQSEKPGSKNTLYFCFPLRMPDPVTDRLMESDHERISKPRFARISSNPGAIQGISRFLCKSVPLFTIVVPAKEPMTKPSLSEKLIRGSTPYFRKIREVHPEKKKFRDPVSLTKRSLSETCRSRHASQQEQSCPG